MDIYGVIKILSVVPDECNGCLDNSPVAHMPLNTAPFVQVTMSHTLLSLGTNHRLSLPPRDTNPPIRSAENDLSGCTRAPGTQQSLSFNTTVPPRASKVVARTDWGKTCHVGVWGVFIGCLDLNCVIISGSRCCV